MQKEKYSSPQILNEFTNCEPVETGCCLRSCGGSPHHIDGESKIDPQMELKIEEAIKVVE